MSRIYWDAMLFVYLIEQHTDYGPTVQQALDRMSDRGDSLCTSIFTLGEVLVKPYALGANSIAEEIKTFLRSPSVELLPFDEAAVDHYARIRAKHKVTPPDAIHLATAAAANVDVFVTNDRALHKLLVPGIQFVVRTDADFF